MSLSCNFRTSDGSPSLLYAQLEQLLGEERAVAAWYKVQSIRSEWPSDQEPAMDWVNNALELGLPKNESELSKIVSLVKPNEEITPTILKERVQALITEAAANPSIKYEVGFSRNTPGINTAGKGSPRIGMTELATMFVTSGPLPKNLAFKESFKTLMGTLPSIFLPTYMTDPKHVSPTLSKEELEYQAEQHFVKIRDAQGNHTGAYFSYDKQQVVLDSLMYMLFKVFNGNPTGRQNEFINAVKQQLINFQSLYFRVMNGESVPGVNVTTEVAKKRYEELNLVLNSLYVKDDPNNFWTFLLERMKSYGMRVKQNVLTDEEEEDQIDADEKGRGVEDYYDDAFTIDRKDSASNRLKWWLAVTEKAQVSRQVSIPISNALDRVAFLMKERTYTARNKEFVNKLNIKSDEIVVTKIDDRLFRVYIDRTVTKENKAALSTQVSESLEEGMVLLKLEPINNASFVSSRNYLGLPELVDFEQTYKKLINKLASKDLTYKSIIAQLTTDPDPIMQRVAARLQEAKNKNQGEIINEFITVMYNQYTQFLIVKHKTNSSGSIKFTSGNIFNANQRGQQDVLKKEWREMQKLSPIAYWSESGEIQLNRTLIDELNTDMLAVNEAYKKLQEKEASTVPDAMALNFFKKLMISNGIIMPDNFYSKFINALPTITRNTQFPSTLAGQFSFDKNNKPVGIFSLFMEAYYKEESVAETIAEEKNLFTVQNPFYEEGNRILSLMVDQALYFFPRMSSDTHRSGEGKNIYDHTLPTIASERFQKLIGEDSSFRENLQNSFINERNPLITTLNSDKTLRDRMLMVYPDTISADNSTKKLGTPVSKMSKRERILFGLSLIDNNGNANYAGYITLTHSDKKYSPILYNAPRIRNTIINTGAGYTLSREAFVKFYNLFQDEYTRIVRTYGIKTDNEAFNVGKEFFYAFPDFNYDRMEKLVKEKVISQEEMDMLWGKGKKLKDASGQNVVAVIYKVINNQLKKQVKRSVETWQKENLVTTDTLPFSAKHINRLCKEMNILYSDGNYMMYENGVEVSKSGLQMVPVLAELAAWDYQVNSTFINIAWSRAMLGDPAQFWKGSIEKTMVEYKKRLAKDIAPGKHGSVEHAPTIRYMVADDIESVLEELPHKTVHTDAQEIMTVEEWANTQYTAGLLKQSDYEELIKIVNSSDNYKIPDKFRFIFQPQKPVFVGVRDAYNVDTNTPLNGVKFDVYVKSSVVVLNPELTEGRELNKLRQYMERNKIGRLAFKSAVKGGSTIPAKIFNDDGTIAVYNKNWDKSWMDVPRDQNRTQQEIPYHGKSETITTVTQADKNIVDGIHGLSFTLPGHENELSADEIIAYKDAIRIRQVKRSVDELYQKVSDDSGINKKALLSKLQEELKARPKGYSSNDLLVFDYLDKLPFHIAPSFDRLEPALLSLITNAVKLDVPGKSYVQVSPAGFMHVKSEGKTLTKRGISSVEAKELYKRVEKIDQPVSPYLIALQYLAGGGKVDSNSIRKEVSDESGAERDYAVRNESKSINNIVHSLWEDLTEDLQNNISTDDLKDELIDAISVHTTRREAAERFLIKTDPDFGSDRNVKTYEEYQPDGDLITVGDYDGGYLKTLRVEDGVVKPAQVLVPFKFYNKEGKLLDINDYVTVVDGKRKIDHSKLPEELLRMVGMRIPNQGHSSMLPIEIVGFLPESAGDSIIVPAAITWQMGADFDVDKLFTYHKEYKVGKDGVIRLRKDTYENPGLKKDKAVDADEYFNIFWSILTHPEMVGKVMSKLDKPDLADEAADELSEPSYYFDPLQQVEEYMSERDAKELVGWSSLPVTLNAVIQSIPDLSLVTYDYDSETDPGQEVAFKGFKVLSKENGEFIYLNKLSGYGTTTYKGSNRTKNDHQIIIQNAFLDNTKNPYSSKINLNKVTYPVAAALVQLQSESDKIVGIPLLTSFLRQPVIRDYVDAVDRGEDSLSAAKMDTAKEMAFRAALLLNKLKKESDEQIELELDERELRKVLDGTYEKDSYKYNKVQYIAISFFSQLSTVGEYLSTIQRSVNHDSKGVGSSVLGVYNNDELTVQLKSSFISNGLGIHNLDKLYEPTKLQGYLRSTANDMAKLFGNQILPYGQINNALKSIKRLIGRSFLTKEDSSNFIKQLRAANVIESLQRTGFISYNLEAERSRLLYNTVDNKSLAKRVLEARNSWAKTNTFINRIDAKIALTATEPDYVSYSVIRATTQDDIETMRAWIDMLNSENAEEKQLGEDLIRWGVLMDFNGALAKHIPIAYLAEGVFSNLLRSDNEINLQIDQFLRSNPHLLPRFSKNLTETGKEYSFPPKEIQVPLPNGELLYKASNLLINNGNVSTLAPYISYYYNEEKRWVLYTAAGEENGSAIYKQTHILGNTQVDEILGVDSLFKENRVAQDLFEKENTADKKFDNDWDTVQDLLNQVALNKEENNVIKRMAGLLSAMNKPIKPNNVVRKNFKLNINSIMDSLGSMNVTGTLNLHSNLFSKNNSKLGSILVHELLHYQTDIIAMSFLGESSSYIKNRYDKFEKNLLETLKKELLEKYPNAMETLGSINDLREQALDVFKSKLKDANKNTDLLLKEIANGNYHKNADIRQKLSSMFTEKQIKIAYSLSSNVEFISNLYDGPDLAIFLNGIKNNSDERSVFDKIIDLISELLTAFSELMGMQVEKGSILESAIKETLLLIKDDYISQGTPPSTNGGFSITNQVIETAKTTDKVSQVILELTSQLESLRGTYIGLTNSEQRAEKRMLIETIEQQISELSSTRDINLISKVGKAQIKWVERIVNKPNPSPNQVITAQLLAKTWMNLLDYLYNTGAVINVDPEWRDISNTARKLNDDLLPKAIEAHRESSVAMFDGFLSPIDYSPNNVKDTDRGELLVRSSSAAAKSKVVQYIASHIEQTGRVIDQDVSTFVKNMYSLEQEMKAAGLSIKNFTEDITNTDKETGKWSLITPYSPEWTNFHKGERKKLYSKLALIKAKGLDPAIAAKSTQEVWKKYWSNMTGYIPNADKYRDNPPSCTIDTRKVFDPNNGNILDTEEAKTELARIKALIGEEMTERALRISHKRFLEYIEYRESTRISLETRVLEKEITQEEATRIQAELIDKYSPNAFMNNLTGKQTNNWLHSSERFLVFVPVSPKYYDSKYTEIKENPVKYEYYLKIKETLEKLKSYLPVYLQEIKMGEEFLPVVQKSLLEDTTNIWGYIQNLPQSIVNSLTASSYEESLKAFEGIPLRFIREKDDNEEISHDLFGVIKTFGAMSIHYRHFADANDVIALGTNILGNINNKLSASDDPNGIRNAMDGIRYMKEYMIFKQPRKLEGDTGIKIYSANPKTQLKQATLVRKLQDELADLDKAYEEGGNDPDKEMTFEEYSEKRKAIMDKMPVGRTIYGSKLGDSLIRYAQLKALSYNPFSGVANLTFGIVSAVIHANGRTDFNAESLFKAAKLVLSGSSKKYFTAGASNNDTAIKILSLMDKLGIIGDVVDSHYGKVQFRDQKSKWRRMADPYNWLRSGDYFVRAMNTVALLLDKKITVTVDGQPQEISLWEAFDTDGNWDTAKYGENPDWSGENTAELKEWNKFRNKAIRVNIMIMGNADKNSPKMANKWILGRLLGQFRSSWLPEGWYNRFGDERPDAQLGRDVKGRYITLKQMGPAVALKTILQQYASVFTGSKQWQENRINGVKLKEVDVENMRKNFAELNWYLTLSLVILALDAINGGLDDDDDDADKKWQIIRNVFMRTKQDITFYSSPEVFNTLTRDIVPSLNVVTDLMKVLPSTYKVMMHDDYEFEQWLRAIFRAGLPIPQATMINKLDYMMNKDLEDLGR